jgi:hypothetical protein
MLHERYCNATGPAFAIAFSKIDWDHVDGYIFDASYSGGKALHDAYTLPLPLETTTMGGLVKFLQTYVREAPSATVLLSNPLETRATMEKLHPRESRTAFFKEEVYHILNPDDDTFESFESAIREGSSRFGIGVCSQSVESFHNQVISEMALQSIVESARHIVVSAFDETGFLIWTPQVD